MRKINKYLTTYKDFIANTSIEDMQNLVANSTSMSDLFRKQSMCAYSLAFRTVEKYFDEHNIDYSHFSSCNPGHTKRNFDNIFCENSTACSKIVRDEYRKIYGEKEHCAICGITEWNNEKIVLQVDHINGDHNDNRLENLRLICPNCHSQTETFCRNKISDIHDCLICGIPMLHKGRFCYNCYHDIKYMESLIADSIIDNSTSVEEISVITSFESTLVEKIIQYNANIKRVLQPEPHKIKHAQHLRGKKTSKYHRSTQKAILTTEQYNKIKSIFIINWEYTKEILDIANINNKNTLYHAIKRYEHEHNIERSQSLSELYKQHQEKKHSTKITFDFIVELLNSSFKSMGKKYNVSDNTIRKWLTGAGYPADFDGLYAIYESESGSKHPKQITRKKKKATQNEKHYIIKVAQLDNENNIINIYNSAREADPIGHGKRVHECCRGDRPTAGGFVWRYLGVDNEPIVPSELDTYEFNAACHVCGSDTGFHDGLLCPACEKHQEEINTLLPKPSLSAISQMSQSKSKELCDCLLECLNDYPMAQLARLIGCDSNTLYAWFEHLGMSKSEIQRINAENNKRRKKK